MSLIAGRLPKSLVTVASIFIICYVGRSILLSTISNASDVSLGSYISSTNKERIIRYIPKRNDTKISTRYKKQPYGYVKLASFAVKDNATQFNRGIKVESLRKAQFEFASLVNIPTIKCKESISFDYNVKIGAYEMCVDGRLKPDPSDCLVYGFGIGSSWSFEDGFRDYGCEVHSFDPSMGLKDHIRSEGHTFHDLGLWGSDTINKKFGWKLNSLGTIMANLGHTEKNIDVLKVDIEDSEWPFLHDFVRTRIPVQVKQFILEIHSPISAREPLTMSTLRTIYNDISTLMDSFGFQLFKTVPVNLCCSRKFGTFTPKGMFNLSQDICCYELNYINTNYV